MNAKTKDCFKPHVLMHSLFGLGLGLVLAALAPFNGLIWAGLLLMLLAFALDYMRKG